MDLGPDLAPICVHCGQPEIAELFEVWDHREFMVETCCEGMHEAVNEFLAEDPKAAGTWLAGLSGLPGSQAGLLTAMHGAGVRRVIEDAGQLVIDWNLQLLPVKWQVAKNLVARYHRHCPPPVGWRFGTGVTNGPGVDNLIGVITVGRPVARGYDPARVLEVNRLCIRDDIAQGLVWNACSLLYGWASREAKKRKFRKIVTYTLESEGGTSLRAAGWIPEAKTRGGSRNTPSRARTDKTSTEPKIRWAPRWCAESGGGAAPLTLTRDGVRPVLAEGDVDVLVS